MNGMTTNWTVEVRIYHYGALKLCTWCTSESDAAGVVETWKALDGVRCEVVALSA
jgi:hypothetical protein